MNAPFLAGLAAAACFAQIAMGVFFVFAHLVRREREHLLFGLLSFALAFASLGFSLLYSASDLDGWRLGSGVAVMGCIAAFGLNLHFVMLVVRSRWASRAAALVYTSCAAFELMYASSLWRDVEHYSVRPVLFLSILVEHVTVQQRLPALAFYVTSLAGLLIGFVLLVDGYRRGRRELLPALIGASLIPLAALNDVALVTGVRVTSVYLLPHTFLFYSFAVAISLLVRYRDAISELHETTRNLARRTEELRRSYQDMQLMEDELGRRQQLAAVGELAAAIAHEVRNPLAVIVNAVAGLRRPNLRGEDRETLLQIVDEEVARLNRLVTDLLRFARPVSISMSKVNLRELAEQTRTMVGEKHRVQVSAPLDPQLETINVDAGLLRLVLENLVENACQAMPDGGTLAVRISESDIDHAPAVRIEVEDSGHGMEPRVLERARKPFFTTRPTGTGLGLPIVERIIQAHGGEISIESSPGRGTRVSLAIPRSKAARRITLDGIRALSSSTTAGD